MLSVFLLALGLAIPIILSRRETENPQQKQASVVALFAPVSIAISNILLDSSPLTSLTLNLLPGETDRRFLIIVIIKSVLKMLIFAICYLVFAKNHLKRLPPLLFFAVPGVTILWNYILNSVQALIIRFLHGNNLKDYYYTELLSVMGKINVAIWMVVSYLILKQLILKSLSDREPVENANKTASVAAIFAPLSIAFNILLYSVISNLISYYSRYDFSVLFWTTVAGIITNGISLIFCIGVYELFTRKYRKNLPFMLFLTAFGVSSLQTFFGGFIDLFFGDLTKVHISHHISLSTDDLYVAAILSVIGYFITKNVFIKYLKGTVE